MKRQEAKAEVQMETHKEEEIEEFEKKYNSLITE